MQHDTTKNERHLEWIRELYLGTDLMFSELNIPVNVKDDKFIFSKEFEDEVRVRVTPEYFESEIRFK
jgi:hypothetical protein